MNIRLTLPVRAVLPVVVLLTLAAEGALSQQVAIGRIDQMPDSPSPYLMRNWKSVAASFDSIAFDVSRPGQYLPLIQLYSNTVNYPGQGSFRYRATSAPPERRGGGHVSAGPRGGEPCGS
jgi:hypothetical protein